MKSLLHDCKDLGLTRFHAICYVVRAPDRKLSSGEKEVFAKVPKIFARSPDVNIVANFSDDAVPAIKHALISEDITYRAVLEQINHFDICINLCLGYLTKIGIKHE